MPSTKTDTEVQEAILQALNQTSEPIKPNKVRKWVCNKLAKGATWTQFAQALEYLLENNQITEKKEEDGETYLQPLSAQKNEKEVEATNTKASKDDASEEIEMEVPKDIIHHLTRKGKRKQKNIEESTKTKFVLSSSSSSTSLKIIGDSKNHCKAAKLMIDKMLQSYQKHPDRFQFEKKAGGTLKEQEKAKQLKENVRKFNRHHYLKEDESKDKQEGQKQHQPKKKKRKFY